MNTDIMKLQGGTMKFQPIYKCPLCGATSTVGDIINVPDSETDEVIKSIFSRQDNIDPTENMLDSFLSGLIPNTPTISVPPKSAMCKCGNGMIGKAFFAGFAPKEES